MEGSAVRDVKFVVGLGLAIIFIMTSVAVGLRIMRWIMP